MTRNPGSVFASSVTLGKSFLPVQCGAIILLHAFARRSQGDGGCECDNAAFSLGAHNVLKGVPSSANGQSQEGVPDSSPRAPKALPFSPPAVAPLAGKI